MISYMHPLYFGRLAIFLKAVHPDGWKFLSRKIGGGGGGGGGGG